MAVVAWAYLITHRHPIKALAELDGSQSLITTMAPNPQCAALAAAKEKKGAHFHLIRDHRGS